MTVDVLVVGAGPAGLAAAIELRRLGVEQVVVADREPEAGGVPRHCYHTGYGLRDLRRIVTGPAYARRYSRAATEAGASIRCSATVTALARPAPGGPWQASVTSPAGLEHVTASAVLLATGCRERPRTARLVPGDRPAGVLTTGELQQRVYLSGERIAGRALIAGAEHVSFSAMLTLAHAGARVLALVTREPRQQSYLAFQLAAALGWRVPVWTSTEIARINGASKLAMVEVRDMVSGATRPVPCDTLVFTGDWIADHELARLAGAAYDSASTGPVVDTRLRTSLPGLFAAGNLVHPGETADVAALAGRHAARQIAASLRSDQGDAPAIPVRVTGELAWIAPGAIAPGLTPPPLDRFVLRGTAFRRAARIEVCQDDRVLATSRVRLMPGRSYRLSADWVRQAHPGGGPVEVRLS